MISNINGKKIEQVKEEVQKLVNEVGQEKKRLAQEALSKGTIPQMIFCKYCGARNKSDQSFCVSCNAPLS